MGENRDDIFSTGTNSLDYDLLAKTSKTSLSEKYSVHNNDAAIEADFKKWLAEGDMIENEMATGNNSNNANNANKSNQMNGAEKMDGDKSIDSDSIRANGMIIAKPTENGNDKNERIMEWAQNSSSQASQSMSMQVASIFSDHDYLSQENMQGLITENEENHNASQNLSNGNADQTAESNGTENDKELTKIRQSDIDDFKDMLKTLESNREYEENVDCLKQIQEKAKAIRSNLMREKKVDDKVSSDSDNDSDVIFSRDHSEPLEYAGKSTFESITESDDTDDDVIKTFKQNLSLVAEIKTQIEAGLQSSYRGLRHSRKNPIAAQTEGLKTLNTNFKTLIADIAGDLMKMAKEVETKDAAEEVADDRNSPQASKSKNVTDSGRSTRANSIDRKENLQTSSQKNQEVKERLLANSSSSSMLTSESESESLSQNVRRRKKRKSRKLSSTQEMSQATDSESLPGEQNVLIKNEPEMNIPPMEFHDESNGTRDGKDDFYGFGHHDNFEADAKSEEMQNSYRDSDALPSQLLQSEAQSEDTDVYDLNEAILKMNETKMANVSADNLLQSDDLNKNVKEEPSPIITYETPPKDSLSNGINVYDDKMEHNNNQMKKEATVHSSMDVDDEYSSTSDDDVKLEKPNEMQTTNKDKKVEATKFLSSEARPTATKKLEEAIDSGDADSENEEDGEAANDDEDGEIERLLDFSSLGIKRKNPSVYYAPIKTNGTSEPKKDLKKQTKDDLLQSILQKDENEQLQDSDSSGKSDVDEITEEQFLKDTNLMLKEQLLQDSSDESDSNVAETEHFSKLNGSQNLDLDSDDFDDDDKATSDSDVSLMDKFLASHKENVSDSDRGPRSKSVEKMKESTPKKRASQSSSGADRQKISDILKSIETDSDSNSSEADKPKRRTKKSIIGQNVFANIDKEVKLVVPTDDDKSDQLQASTVGSSKSDAKETIDDTARKSIDADEPILDTTMFKSNKREVSPSRLSKILTSSREREKQAASRATPDECISLSSDDDLDLLEPTTTEKEKAKDDEDDEDKEKRVKRKLLRDDQLHDDTKQAQKEEQERIKRLEKKNERLTQIIESQRSQSQETPESDDQPQTDPNEIVLDYDSKKKMKIAVHPGITKQLKPHQVDGIKFMYDNCYGSVDSLDKHPGSGCILAHCMGLGKTLQLISLLHTVITYPQLKTDKVLVICPKSTVMNWKEEIERWLNPIKGTRKLKLFQFQESSDISSKLRILDEWSKSGTKYDHAGCLLMGYEAFRVLVFHHASKKCMQNSSAPERERLEKATRKYLLNPGADLVICDEGHTIKNQKSTTSTAVNKIQTKRRIILTGTPIQNNLKEYYAMVNFIKPSFLGTEKEFANLYVNPIRNGQHKDSSKSEIKHMKQRSYVLHKKLSKFVQRREAALLKTFLPEKYEYVLFIPMTAIQNNLYEYFLDNNPNKDRLGGKSLIPDYTVLRKIWTHPKVLENAYINAISGKTNIKAKAIQNHGANSKDSEDEPDDLLDSQTGNMSVTHDWWRDLLSKEDLETIIPSNKLKVLFEILNMCQRNGEKCLIFSAFVAVLDVVEFFMKLITEQNKERRANLSQNLNDSSNRNPSYAGLEKFHGLWEFGHDYYRLDGKTPKNRRHEMITNFNNPKNLRTRTFLISAKAGGQGINLTGANRVVLLDTSWNPSNDQQNIFRVFRLGQKNVCYIYRLLAMGTMEEKVYSRSVTKQAMSCRVMDEQQIDRHYNMAELTELYTLTKPNMSERPMPTVPKDEVLGHLLLTYPDMVYKYHEHDSLLENKAEQDLSEEEKADAWRAYEEDTKRKNETSFNPFNANMGMMQNYGMSSYANALYGNYNHLQGVGGGLGAYSSMMQQYNNYYDPMRYYNDYNAFYNSLMNSNSSINYNQQNSGLLSPSHSPTAAQSSMYSSARNWLQNPSSSAYSSNLLQSMAQSASSSSKNNYNNAYKQLNSLYNTFGSPTSGGSISLLSPGASTSKSPPSATSTTNELNAQLALLQSQFMSSSTGSSSNSSTSSVLQSTLLNASGFGGQQGPNAMRNPMLSKELSIPTRNPNFDAFNLPSIPTSVITKSTTNTSSTTATISAMTTTNSTGSTMSASNKAPLSSDNNVSANANSSLLLQKSNANNADKPVSKKPPRASPDAQITIKDVNSINDSVRKSPESRNNAPSPSNGNTSLFKNKQNDNVSSTAKASNGDKTTTITVNTSLPGTSISTVTSTKSSNEGKGKSNGDNSGITISKTSATASKTAESRTPTSASNMGIVYPKPSTTSNTVTSTSISKSPQLSNANDNRVSTTNVNVSSKTSTQPMPSIIRKAQYASSSSAAVPASALPSSESVVNALAQNKSLTVTPKRTANPNMMVQIPKINNSITVSPIPSTSAPTAANSYNPRTNATATKTATITPGRNRLALTKSNTNNASSIVPIALTKSPMNQINNSKSSSPITITPVKPNMPSARILNATPISATSPATVTSTTPRNTNLPPKVLVQAKNLPRPIVQQQSSTSMQFNKTVKPGVTMKSRESSPIIISSINNKANKAPSVAPTGSSISVARAMANSTTSNVMMNDSRKRAAQSINNKAPVAAKRQKLSLGKPSGGAIPMERQIVAPNRKQSTALQNIRIQQRSQPRNSQVMPVEIVELDD